MEMYVQDAPAEVAKNDPNEKVNNDAITLEKYFNDIYKLLLNTMSLFDKCAKSRAEEHDRLRALVDELIRVKTELEALSPG
jgi:hypothetical protein